jgi:dephospho-CoA kinase
MLRSLSTTILEERKSYRKMIFIAGPRQVGKTTVLNQIRETLPGPVLNWHNLDDRARISKDSRPLFEDNSNIPVIQVIDREGVMLRKKIRAEGGSVGWAAMSASRFCAQLV